MSKETLIAKLYEEVDNIYVSLDEISNILAVIDPDDVVGSEGRWMAHIDIALENRGGYAIGSPTLVELINDLEG